MKHPIFRSILLSLMVLILLWSPFGALAEAAYTPSGTSHFVASMDGEMGILYTVISSITGSCYISSGAVQMGGTVTAQGRTGTCKVTLTLQKKSGGSWKDDTSWSATGSGSVTKYASKTASTGVFYRLKVTGSVTVGGKTETDTIYTTACAR